MIITYWNSLIISLSIFFFITTMWKFLKRKADETTLPSPSEKNKVTKTWVEYNPENLPTDPGLRPSILDYNPNVQDKV